MKTLRPEFRSPPTTVLKARHGMCLCPRCWEWDSGESQGIMARLSSKNGKLKFSDSPPSQKNKWRSNWENHQTSLYLLAWVHSPPIVTQDGHGLYGLYYCLEPGALKVAFVVVFCHSDRKVRHPSIQTPPHPSRGTGLAQTLPWGCLSG